MAKACCGKWKKNNAYCKSCPKKVKKYKKKTPVTKEKVDIKRLQKQMEFIIEIDKLKTIIRQSHIIDCTKKENDAEHSWHIAVMALILSEHANFKNIDILKVIKMLLIHDLVEIDAGDTYAYDEKGHEDKREREEIAAKRIFGLLPKDQGKEYYKLWLEFEDLKTKESRFASALDRIQPILLNYHAQGKSWKEHQVSKQMVIKRNEYTKDGSRKIWRYIEKILEDATEKGYLINED